MNTRSDSPTSAPRPECDTIARQIPLLRTGALAPGAATAVEEHIRTCAACRSQRADLDRVETQLRRIYSPGASPFQPITFDEIQSRIDQQPHSGVTQDAGNSMHLLTLQPKNLPSSRVKRSHERPADRRLPTWLPRLTAVAAVITLVSLFALLFHAIAPKGTGTRAPIPTVSPATATPIHYLGARAHWEQSAQIHGDPQTPYMVYTVSQVDPRVMYRYQLVVEKVERSNSSGASWQTLPIPTYDFAPNDHPILIVSPSPLDSRTVVLTYQLMPGNSTCPSGDFCEIQYISRDGGDHWQRLKLPTGSALSVIGFPSRSISTLLSGSMFIAQGTHLVAALRSDNGDVSGFRIVTSPDSGDTWVPVDSAIVANKQEVIECVATPAGSSFFALTVAAGTRDVAATGNPRLLWRSDDQGKHWVAVGTFPSVKGSRSRVGTASTHLVAAALGPDGRPLVYYVDESETAEQQALPLDMSTVAPDHIFASRDGGNTWTPAPISGIPGNFQIVAAHVGQLADGSTVAQVSRLTTKQVNQNSIAFIESDTAYYAWKPGDAAWRQLTPAAPGQSFSQQWLAPARSDAPETIWALTQQDNIWTLQRCVLN